MEQNPLSVTQVMAVTNIEVCISAFSDNPEYYFEKITVLIDEHRIIEHREIMNYLYELFVHKSSPEYIEEFRKKYHIQTK
jgi:hypothetical protein